MPKVSVYLPDDLAAEVRRRGLPLSSLAQAAVHDAIQAQDKVEWVARMRDRRSGTRPDVDVSAVMAAVRDELGVIVLDASALVEVVLGLEHRDWVLARLEDDDVLAPPHQLLEVTSVLARLERAGSVTPDVASAALDDAVALPQQVEPLSPALVRRAYALRGSVRVADSFYVALAEREDAVLLTTDRRLARAGLPVPGEPPVR